MLRDLKEHMLGWYDVKRQGCTNDSLAENPVLKNLSNRKVYSYDFNDLILAAGVTKAGDYKALIPAQSLSSSRNIIAKDVNVGDSFPAYSVRISGLQEGNIIELPTGSGLARKDGVYNIVKHTYTEDEDLRYRYVLRSGDYNDLTIEILPLTLDLQLHNFEFGGLSGIGSYMYNLGNINKWNNTSRAEEFQVTDNVFKFINIKENYNLCFILFRLWYLKEGALIRVQITGIPDGGVVELGSNGRIVRANKDGIYEGIAISDNNNNTTVSSINCIGSTITIKWLPSFPNSLVFNGVAPEYVINKNNVNIVSPNFGEFINNNTFHITYNSHGVDIVNQSVTGNAGESLTVSLPSFKVRVKGVKKNSKISFGAWDNLNGYAAKPIVITEDGTYSIPIRSITVEPTDETFIPEIHIFRLITSLTSEETDQNLDITVEFLPNYAAPTTKMYGDIPEIPLNTVKCMMMDFTPFADVSSFYYTQRTNANNRFSILNYGNESTYEDTSRIIAYSIRNSLGTYINGTVNTNKTVLSLLQQRQVVSVNNSNPIYDNITIGHESHSNFVPQMALNSLILFDRELTTEEMAYAIEKLMGGGNLLSHQEYEMNMADTDPFTLYLDFSYQLPEDVTAYTGEIVGDHIRTHVIKGNIIPANTGVLVKTTTPGIKTFKEVYKAPSYIPVNDLHGVTVDTPLTDLAGTNDQVLTLGVVDGVIGIRKPALSYIKANRCYVLVVNKTPDDNNPVTDGEAD